MLCAPYVIFITILMYGERWICKLRNWNTKRKLKDGDVVYCRVKSGNGNYLFFYALYIKGGKMKMIEDCNRCKNYEYIRYHASNVDSYLYTRGYLIIDILESVFCDYYIIIDDAGVKSSVKKDQTGSKETA